jgi:hypothetical protein
MEAGRIGGGEQSGYIAGGSQERRESLLPFPVSPKGKAGAGGFPPRRKKRRLPPQEGKPPCAIPQKDARKIFVDRGGLLMEADGQG